MNARFFLAFVVVLLISATRAQLYDGLLWKLNKIFNAAMDLKPININLKKIHEIDDEYDFIIVGSGSAGSVIANRLSEIPYLKILLLEAGKTESTFCSVPLLGPLLQLSDYNWAYTMEPQDNFCLGMLNHRCAWPRGKALGGSTVLNYMIYMRGNRLDYDKWARDGNPGWSYEEVLPYFMKSEDVHLDKYDWKYHGHGGYLHTSHVFKSEITGAFLEAAQEIGADIVDYNGETQLGYAYMQATVKRGRRHSVARAFLEPAIDRKNLHILTKARVVKLNMDKNRVSGVEFYHKNRSYRVRTRKEVILSAGALSSPQLLMLSGIGPQEHLQELGIPLIQDLPVGQNLQDHIAYTGLAYLINRTVENPSDVFNPKFIDKWRRTGKGPLSSLGGIEAVGFVKTKFSEERGNNPDLELIFVGGGSHHTDFGLFNRRFQRITDEYYNKAFKPIENIPSWTVFPMLLHPKSKGFLKLNTTNPFDVPLFYGNYFSDPNDKKVLIEGIKLTEKLSKTIAFQKFNSTLSTIPVPGCENLEFNSEEYWSCALERFTITVHHQVGTCKMGPPIDLEAVVNHELKVYGVSGLRVADTSVIPFALSAHTNAPSIMIGEKAADLIKFEHNFL